MPRPKRSKTSPDSELTELVRDLIIVQLAAAGLGQKAIREIVGCDVNRVSRIYKHVRAARSAASEKA
jgi:hypothetical protein